MRKIGIFGGSFDPIHFGHLRPVLEILDALSLDEIRFIPSGQPPHRQAPMATASLRLQMVKAAVAMEPRFIVDEREIERDAPSYTVDTLTELRQEFSGEALVLLVGMDAFLGLPGWYQWRRIFQCAHVIVAHRPGWVLQSGSVLVDELHQ
ncbi:MAG: nicotinate-nucleotide adenylyltransferase, partial [Gammaproteobacteria bacterium]|nr:nicotinate-nucleotide adenylyltransferase [Gammaproteobacteria bacterium]